MMCTLHCTLIFKHGILESKLAVLKIAPRIHEQRIGNGKAGAKVKSPKYVELDFAFGVVGAVESIVYHHRWGRDMNNISSMNMA